MNQCFEPTREPVFEPTREPVLVYFPLKLGLLVVHD